MQQQPLTQQPDQMGTQQALGQQMVLCPVRLVYETQILVQPGDHIQPNQTFFINPQNPPPWMQNSLQNSLQPRQPIQNQVVYVHQLPNNIVSSIQQPMDQNQLYLQQNFPNFQIQQPMLTQGPSEVRQTMQLANIMPNMVQNVQQNMVQNVQHSVQNERPVQSRQMQPNPQMIQNQIAVNRPIQNQITNPTLEVQGQVLMRPQMHQQGNIQRPVMNVNQMQNVQNHPTLASLHNVVSSTGQNFIHNTGRPGPNPNAIRTSMANNVVNVAPVPKIRELSPMNAEKAVNSPVGNVAPNVRSFVPNYYRPIQPRPQITHNTANMPKVQQHIPVQTIPNTPAYDHSKNHHQSSTNNFAIIQELNNPTQNRKRKSESPDESQKKIATPPTIKPNYNAQNIAKPNYSHVQESTSKPQYYTIPQSITATKLVNEIGTNTSPVHRPKLNPQLQMNANQIVKANNEPQPSFNKELPGLQDKEKLIRNTVFTQARGRVLQDKIDETKPQPMEIAVETEQVKMVENKPADPEIRAIEEQPKPAEIPKAIADMTAGTDIVIKIIKEPNKNVKDVETSIQPQETISSEQKPVDKVEQTEKPEEIEKVVVDVKKDQENDEKLLFSDRNTIRQDNIDILTHVVDGYVIQESNIAFPIRKPLKEKTLYTNSKLEENEKKDLLRESIKEELKSNVDIPLLPFHYLLLDSAKEEKEKAEEREREEAKVRGNPFSQLQHTTVKTWTVDDLSAHLLKFNWKDTVSLLQDHEIDGESLYLVSKQQLQTIGVAEEHADVICEFVKS